jgi:hypothetical protein
VLDEALDGRSERTIPQSDQSNCGRGRRSPSTFNRLKPQVCAFRIKIGAFMIGMKRPVDSNFVLRGGDAALMLTSGNRDPRPASLELEFGFSRLTNCQLPRSLRHAPAARYFREYAKVTQLQAATDPVVPIGRGVIRLSYRDT